MSIENGIVECFEDEVLDRLDREKRERQTRLFVDLGRTLFGARSFDVLVRRVLAKAEVAEEAKDVLKGVVASKPAAGPEPMKLEPMRLGDGVSAVFADEEAKEMFLADLSRAIAHLPPPASKAHLARFGEWGQPAGTVRKLLMRAGWQGLSSLAIQNHYGVSSGAAGFALFCADLGFEARVLKSAHSTHTCAAIAPRADP